MLQHKKMEENESKVKEPKSSRRSKQRERESSRAAEVIQQPRALATPAKSQGLELSTDRQAAYNLQLKGIQPSSSLHRFTRSALYS